MPLTTAEVDAAIPVGGTPSRALTNAALDELIADIVAAQAAAIASAAASLAAHVAAADPHPGYVLESALGTNVAAFLATPSSANLAAAVTGETGSGALVFATSPTLVTPALGTPSAVVLTNATGFPGNLGQLQALPDPGADRLLFWDDSAGAYTHLTLGTNLSITSTTLNAAGGGGVAWGAISGTLSDQTDLQTELDAKADALTAGTTISESRALASTDVGRMTDVDTSGGAVVLTLNTGAILDNEVMTFRRVGANALTIVSGTGTVNNPDGVLANNGSIISLIGVGTDAGTLVGFAPAGTPADGSITNAKLADVPTATIKGRDTAGTGVPEDLTASEVRTLLGLVIGTNVQAFNAFLAKLATSVPREITGAATLGPTDTDCTLRFNAVSTAELTLANDATLTPAVGKSTIAVFIQGVGVPTIAAGTATLLGTPRSGLAQNDTIVLVHTGVADTWSYA